MVVAARRRPDSVPVRATIVLRVIAGGAPAWELSQEEEDAVVETCLRGVMGAASAVAPGSTDTPILAESARLYDLAGPGDFAAQQPIERLLDPGEVAAMIAWLCGPGGAAVTGTTVSVDGGLSI